VKHAQGIRAVHQWVLDEGEDTRYILSVLVGTAFDITSLYIHPISTLVSSTWVFVRSSLSVLPKMSSAREDDLAMRAASGDEVAATVPRHHFSAETPYPRGSPGYKCELAAFFPIDNLWSRSSQGFGQVLKESPHIEAAFICILDLMFTMAHRIGDRVTEMNEPKQIVTWTNVPLLGKDESAGFMLRILFQEGPVELATIIQKFLQDNDKLYSKCTSAKGRKRMQHLVTTHKYEQACFWYRTRNIGANGTALQDFNKEGGNPYNPFKTLSLDVALAKMRNATAHPDFTKRLEWLRESQEGHLDASFPRLGRQTYAIPAAQMKPDERNLFYFPHVLPRIELDNPEQLKFLKQAGVGQPRAEGEDHDSEDEELDEESLKKLFQMHITSSTGDSNTLDAFKKRVQVAKDKLDQEFPDCREKRFINWWPVRNILIEEFFDEFLESDAAADVGDAIHALAKAYRDWIKEYKHFHLPMPKSTANLSRFGDLQVTTAAIQETVGAVATSHQELISLMLSILHIYYNTDFNSHAVLAGPPEGGKTHVMKELTNRLIEDTYDWLAKASAASKMVPGKKNDLKIEFHEEVIPSSIGVSSNPGRRNASTNNSEEEALIKSRTTGGGRGTAQYKSVVDGVHKAVKFKMYGNAVMVLGTNTLLPDIPKSVRSRFLFHQFTKKVRLNSQGQNVGMFQKMAQEKDPNLRSMRKQFYVRCRRNQIFHCILGLLSYVGLFATPDTSAAELIWTKALMLAGQKGLHSTDNARQFEMHRFHSAVAVDQSAIDRVLDSELRVEHRDVHGNLREWKPLDILAFEKHRWVDTEIAVFVGGLFHTSYEDMTVVFVTEYIHQLLAEKIKNKAIGKPFDQSEAVKSEMKHYYVYPMRKVMGVAYDRDNQQSDLMARFAKQIRERNSSREQAEITEALQVLVDTSFEVEDGSSTKKRVQGLVFANNEMLVSVELMKTATQKDRLKSAYRETLMHSHTKDKNIVYGRSREGQPNMLQTMKIRRPAETKIDPVTKLAVIDPRTNQPMIVPKFMTMDHPTYFSDESLRLSYNVTCALSGETFEQYKRKFSERPCTIVDMDLDDWMSRYHKYNTGGDIAEKLNKGFFPDAPNGSTTPASFALACKKKLSLAARAALKQYPKEWSETRPFEQNVALAEQLELQPEAHSLSLMMRRKRRQEQDLEDQVDRMDIDDARYPSAAVAAIEEDEEDEDGMCSDGDINADDGINADIEDHNEGGDVGASAAAPAAAEPNAAHPGRRPIEELLAQPIQRTTGNQLGGGGGAAAASTKVVTWADFPPLTDAVWSSLDMM
jgi:hypothetical protein